MNNNLIIIGGGPAGMAAAVAASENGITNILIIERDFEPGGILNQCIHNGFGLHKFKEELTGPEYSARYIDMVNADPNITILTDTMVLDITEDKTVHAINSTDGYLTLKSQAIILAMGCRERTRGAINIYGSRPAGVYTAGTAQRFINMEGYMPGKKCVILGSGDIGLIMARRMTLEGAEVSAVLEIMPYSNGLNRNITQCLEDYNIPLMLSHTVTKIHGNERVNALTIAKVDENLKPIQGTEKTIKCDTLLLSVGLIPENEVSKTANIKLDNKTSGPSVDQNRQTNIPGIFACGNVLHVHDLVDFVSEEATIAGIGAAQYIKNQQPFAITNSIKAHDGISYVVPQQLSESDNDACKLFMRVKKVYQNSEIHVYCDDKIIAKKRAAKFLPAEMVTIKIANKDLILNKDIEVKIA